MNRFLFFFLLLSVHQLTFATNNCKQWSFLPEPVCKRLHQIWTKGDNELYLTGYAWHNRAYYSRNKINGYNEKAWGGGLGRGIDDENGNWHGLYAFAFLDSHKNIEPIAGYAFLKTATLHPTFKLGAGLSLFLTARPDIFNNIPFPGVLPWLSVTLSQVSLSATYIPGSKGSGNVLFLFSKWRF